MAVDTGHGASVTFGTTGGTWLVRRISGPELTTPIVDKTYLATSTRRAYMPGDLQEVGPVTLEILFQGAQGLPAQGTVETITITHPTASGNSSPANLAGTGFIRRTKYPDFQTNELQIGEIEFQHDGTTFTYTAAS